RFKDANEWTLAGATVDDLDSALDRAEVVQGIVPTAVEEQVEKSQPEHTPRLQGSQVNLADVEPWPETVSGARVLDEVSKAFCRYVVLPAGAADELALWCAHAHAF